MKKTGLILVLAAFFTFAFNLASAQGPSVTRTGGGSNETIKVTFWKFASPSSLLTFPYSASNQTLTSTLATPTLIYFRDNLGNDISSISGENWAALPASGSFSKSYPATPTSGASTLIITYSNKTATSITYVANRFFFGR